MNKTWVVLAGGLAVVAMNGAVACLSSDDGKSASSDDGGAGDGSSPPQGDGASPGNDASPSLDASQDASPNGLVQLATTGPMNSPPQIAVTATDVYFRQATSVSVATLARVSVNGGAVTPLATTANVNALTVDSTNVYWMSNSTISSVSLDGGSITVLATPEAGVSTNPTGSLNVDSANMYWVQSGGVDLSAGAVQTAPLLGGAVTNLATAQVDPLNLVLTTTNLFWTSADGTGSIVTLTLDGGAPTSFATSPSGQVSSLGLAIDATNVYWGTAGTANGNGDDCVVMKAPIAGGTPVVQLASGQLGPWALASDGTNLYWANKEGGTIMKVAINGGTPPITLVTGRNAPTAIAVDATSLYWQDSDALMKLTPK